MNRNDLFRSFNGLNDDILERSEAGKKRKASIWLKLGAVAACFALVAVGCYGLLMLRPWRGAGAGGGGGDGLTYFSYAGPVFPLSAEEANSDISVERAIDFDFISYTDHSTSYPEITVTDAYTLKNNSDQEQTLTLLYPFTACLYELEELKPVITVDGKRQEPSVHFGPNTGYFTGALGSSDDDSTCNLIHPDSWERYRDLIENGYLSSAFDEYPDLNRPVIVYEVKNPCSEIDETVLNFEFSIDPSKTTVLSYGFDAGYSIDGQTGSCELSMHVPSASVIGYPKKARLIVLGDDIKSYQIKFYENMFFDKVLENSSATVERYQSNLETIFSEITTPDSAGLAAELLFDSGPLSPNPVDHYANGDLEHIVSDTSGVHRIIYLQFPVTVPAGGSVSICAKMVKEDSEDFFTDGPYCNGYDMVTTLGSVLSFRKQTASVSNTESIEIIRQNFGFDLDAGITSVTLDPQEPHYYMDVKEKSTDLN